MNESPHRRRISVVLAAALVAVMFALLAVAQLPERGDGHRPLTANPELEPPDPKPGEPFRGYPDVPNFTTVPRVEELSHFPCSTCHSAMQANPERRKLMAPHPATLDHGDGRFWCLDCHAADSRDELATMANERVNFDQADQVCAQCHYNAHQDWAFGVHGKRVANWQGPREIYSCAHCHDPHNPAVRPRAPEPPPRVRAGLEPMPDGHHHAPLYPWWKDEEENTSDQNQAQ